MTDGTGKLKFQDTFGNWHYCTAELAVAGPTLTGGGAHTRATFLLTAAHCVRPGFKNYSFKKESEIAYTDLNSFCITRNPNWVDPDLGKNVDPFINARFDYAFIKLPSGVNKQGWYQISWDNHDWSDANYNNQLIGSALSPVIPLPDPGGNTYLAMSISPSL
jgi:hypothetical protein